jgi:hypothetical protein
MKTHFTEADLLETYYMQPGESMPVMMHLASCTDCASRYERLERKLREAAACPAEKPETFWSRQRHAIMRRLPAAPHRVRAGAIARVAAAALLVFLSGGVILYREMKPARPAPAPQTTTVAAKAAAVEEMHDPINPWESDELKDFHEMVQWESWVDESKKNGSSL